MRRYTTNEKIKMIEMHVNKFTYECICKYFGCSMSTVFYVTHPEAYEKHKEHMRNRH